MNRRRPHPPTTLTCIVALGIARSGGPWWLPIRIGLAVLMALVLDGGGTLLDVHPATVSR